ncbi:MAG: helix-turn-helix transcriptional regulator [Clostridiaceae bacterium]|nr:helix-turn-helix transcriptional regulator [Clostridiaceae bacterium]
MVNDFPRTLSLLRKEKKISQRKAAGDLGVSQALLSHYENGMREPGLEFLVKASDYYSVSSDYLLGRTMSRDGSTIVAESLPDVMDQKDNVLKGSAMALFSRKVLTNSMSIFFDVLGRHNDRKLIADCSLYLYTSIYKMYRYVYSLRKQNPDNAFPVPFEYIDTLCDIQLKKSELALRQLAADEKHDSETISELTIDKLQANYPQLAPSLLNLLHTVSDNLEGKKNGL